jgi:hypothetical protein
MLEKKMHTMDWAKRANQTIFAMMVVNAYLLQIGCQGNRHSLGGPRKFFEMLAADLIDNTFYQRSLSRRCGETIYVDGPVPDVPESTKHLTWPTSTKQFKKNHPAHWCQGRCMVCKKCIVAVCQSCQDVVGPVAKRQYWICDKLGKECMGMHLTTVHPNLIAE